MAITEAYTGTSAIGTTEFSAPNNANYNIVNVITNNPGIYQVFLDTSDMVAGDQLQIRVYEACRSGDTPRVIYEAYITGTSADTWVSPSLILLNGWDVTLDAIAGTITVLWSIRKVA